MFNDALNTKFSQENLKKFYLNNIKSKSSPGLDKINCKVFENKLPMNIGLIIKKVKNNTYKFTPYKEKLIVKNRDSNPRLISIPTIRDKITLGIVKEILYDDFSEQKQELVQTIIDDISNEIQNHNYFIKIDLTNFYGSLNHDFLMDKVENKIKNEKIITLIEKAIKTPTVNEHESRKKRKKNREGVPQGLSISNILASIYLSDFDKEHSQNCNYKYYRYVDDILILCDEKNYSVIKDRLVQSLTDIHTHRLKIHNEKTVNDFISNGFCYLGYRITKQSISVRESTKHKLEKSLELIFNEYKHSNTKNISFFVWKLNLRITGGRIDRDKYGWLFFFSQITDLEVLFHLDWFIKKLILRFKMTKELEDFKIKKFARTYKEIEKNLHGTKYIPNFSEFTAKEKKNFLTIECNKDVEEMNEDKIDFEFNKFIFASLKDLEKDIQNIS